jgi:endonuclease YncB( thermonuclease family)
LARFFSSDAAIESIGTKIFVDRVLVVLLAGICAMCCGCDRAMAQEPPTPACGGGEAARGTVSRIIDGRTFALDDGREVRLAAIEVPALPQATGSAPPSAAKDALAALADGDDVLLRRADAASDRYGRILAYAYTERDGDELFVQGELIASGLARVGDHVGSRSCAADLLKRENTARTAKLGLWADPYYEVLDAETPADVLSRRGRFALVEGRVLSVRESGATIYVNFGRHWSEDFTVTVLKRNERNFAAAGLDLKGLEGHRVRVRGWVEERNAASGTGGGPWIEAARPEQIESADRE